jgi:beta-phosphoglucomutase-like phosphatase (HAD superfamily)
MAEFPSRFSPPHSDQPPALLCDADGTLFPSEEPAFVASARVTEDFAARFGLAGNFSAENLRLTTTGKNFRTTAQDLLTAAGIRADPDELQRWIDREKVEVTGYLAQALQPQPDVLAALSALRGRHRLAAVSSSALSRLAACFTASGLDELFPAQARFSAEDSLPVPTSKPDPAVYEFALRALGIPASSAIAIEDSTTGARSAVAAGLVTIGIVQFVPVEERKQRVEDLLEVGVAAVVHSWDELADVLSAPVG